MFIRSVNWLLGTLTLTLTLALYHRFRQTVRQTVHTDSMNIQTVHAGRQTDRPTDIQTDRLYRLYRLTGIFSLFSIEKKLHNNSRKILTVFRKTVEDGLNPRLPISSEAFTLVVVARTS